MQPVASFWETYISLLSERKFTTNEEFQTALIKLYKHDSSQDRKSLNALELKFICEILADREMQFAPITYDRLCKLLIPFTSGAVNFDIRAVLNRMFDTLLDSKYGVQPWFWGIMTAKQVENCIIQCLRKNPTEKTGMMMYITNSDVNSEELYSADISLLLVSAKLKPLDAEQQKQSRPPKQVSNKEMGLTMSNIKIIYYDGNTSIDFYNQDGTSDEKMPLSKSAKKRQKLRKKKPTEAKSEPKAESIGISKETLGKTPGYRAIFLTDKKPDHVMITDSFSNINLLIAHLYKIGMIDETCFSSPLHRQLKSFVPQKAINEALVKKG
jgi:hypothetical protein